MRILILLIATSVSHLTGCRDQAARSSDDIIICKQFVNEALFRMDDLKREKFEPGDLTLAQLSILTPRDPEWRDAEFLVLNTPWSYHKDGKKIVIVCAQSRVIDNERVHCVGYSSGETAWLRREQLEELQLRDFSVLPKIRP